jgi:hypothetical protein
MQLRQINPQHAHQIDVANNMIFSVGVVAPRCQLSHRSFPDRRERAIAALE